MDMYFPTPRPVTMPAETAELLDGDLPASAAWAAHVALTPAATAAGCDERGRLWDVVFMYTLAVKVAVRAEGSGPCLRFTFFGVTTSQEPHLCTLFAHVVPSCGGAIVATTAAEALGAELADAIDRYGRLFGEDDEETDDEIDG